LVECPAEDRTKRTERRSSSAGHGGERSLVEEASAVVSLKQGRAVEDTSGQVTRVDASEAVCLSCVASDTDNARVSCIVGTKVHEYLGDSVLAC